MKELKTYAHLYLGCPVRNHYMGISKKEEYEEGILVGVTASEVEPNKTIAIFSNGGDVLQECYIEEISLVLRPLSDMTEEEGNKFFRNKYRDSTVFAWFNCTNVNQAGCEFETTYTSENRKRRRTIPWDSLNGDDFHYLLSHGFDLFGLIDAGLAVSKTETKN